MFIDASIAPEPEAGQLEPAPFGTRETVLERHVRATDRWMLPSLDSGEEGTVLMGHLDDASFTRILGESMVEMADANFENVCQLVDGDRRVIRLNLIAFCAFGLTWAGSDRLDEEQIGAFSAGVLRGAAGKAGVSSPEKIIEMFRNRNLGFVTALMNNNNDPLALSRYFMACCSVNRIEVGFSDIYPDPSALEKIETILGGLTTAEKAMIQKVRAMRDPAIYPMEASKSMEVFNMLMGLMKHIKDSLSRLKESLSQFGR